MKIEEIIEYSKDYKEFAPINMNFRCSVRIDFDFAISLPDMLDKVYYRKDCPEETARRLNEQGIYLLFEYNLMSHDILKVWVKYSNYCLVSYSDDKDMIEIVNRLKERWPFSL